jgi:glycosyltransferase involved in cell wall biosynthesis
MTGPDRDQPIRVLLLIDGLGAGGTERSTVELLSSLRPHGFDSLLVHLFDRNDYRQELSASGGRAQRVAATTLVGSVREVRRQLERWRPHVLHTILFRASLIGRLAAIGSGLPVLTSLVNTTYDPARLQDPALDRLKFRLVKQLDVWSARRLTDHFHAVSPTVRDSAVATMGLDPQRITVIRRGRDAARLGAPSRERRLRARAVLGVEPDAFLLVNLGRHRWQKGQAVLLRAFARVHAQAPRARLWVVGAEGPESRRLREILSELVLEPHARLLGYRADVPEILAAADAFVLPSFYEGLPGAVIEAMALGLPIVASDIAAVREVVAGGRNGVLVPPGDPEALADALLALIDDPVTADALGRTARESFESEFTLEDSIAQWIELYSRLAASTRGHTDASASRTNP